jgi:ElaB/YqjD/DUF883 family membrane-anchored ribosome-binding protein
MKDQTDNRPPEEIAMDIERTRADFSSTIDAIQSKLTPRELMDEAVDYALTTTPGVFSANLVNSVRENPLPLALIGVGIAWLMSANRQPNRSTQRTQRSRRHATYYADMDGDYDDSRERMYVTRSAGSRSTEDGMLDRASSKVAETRQDLKDKASNVGQRLNETASDVAARARTVRESTRNRLHESAESTKVHVNELGQQSRQQYYHAKDRFGRLLDEQPLVVGALGIAVGAALGGSFPSTQREDELMGRTRDDLFGRAKETVREQAETVKQSAQRVGQAAKQEVDRVKEDMSNTASVDMDQNDALYSTRGDNLQTGDILGQQRPH